MRVHRSGSVDIDPAVLQRMNFSGSGLASSPAYRGGRQVAEVRGGRSAVESLDAYLDGELGGGGGGRGRVAVGGRSYLNSTIPSPGRQSLVPPARAASPDPLMSYLEASGPELPATPGAGGYAAATAANGARPMMPSPYGPALMGAAMAGDDILDDELAGEGRGFGGSVASGASRRLTPSLRYREDPLESLDEMRSATAMRNASAGRRRRMRSWTERVSERLDDLDDLDEDELLDDEAFLASLGGGAGGSPGAADAAADDTVTSDSDGPGAQEALRAAAALKAEATSRSSSRRGQARSHGSAEAEPEWKEQSERTRRRIRAARHVKDSLRGPAHTRRHLDQQRRRQRRRHEQEEADRQRRLRMPSAGTTLVHSPAVLSALAGSASPFRRSKGRPLAKGLEIADALLEECKGVARGEFLGGSGPSSYGARGGFGGNSDDDDDNDLDDYDDLDGDDDDDDDSSSGGGGGLGIGGVGGAGGSSSLNSSSSLLGDDTDPSSDADMAVVGGRSKETQQQQRQQASSATHGKSGRGSGSSGDSVRTSQLQSLLSEFRQGLALDAMRHRGPLQSRGPDLGTSEGDHGSGDDDDDSDYDDNYDGDGGGSRRRRRGGRRRRGERRHRHGERRRRRSDRRANRRAVNDEDEDEDAIIDYSDDFDRDDVEEEGGVYNDDDDEEEEEEEVDDYGGTRARKRMQGSNEETSGRKARSRRSRSSPPGRRRGERDGARGEEAARRGQQGRRRPVVHVSRRGSVTFTPAAMADAEEEEDVEQVAKPSSDEGGDIRGSRGSANPKGGPKPAVEPADLLRGGSKKGGNSGNGGESKRDGDAAGKKGASKRLSSTSQEVILSEALRDAAAAAASAAAASASASAASASSAASRRPRPLQAPQRPSASTSLSMVGAPSLDVPSLADGASPLDPPASRYLAQPTSRQQQHQHQHQQPYYHSRLAGEHTAADLAPLAIASRVQHQHQRRQDREYNDGQTVSKSLHAAQLRLGNIASPHRAPQLPDPQSQEQIQQLQQFQQFQQLQLEQQQQQQQQQLEQQQQNLQLLQQSAMTLSSSTSSMPQPARPPPLGRQAPEASALVLAPPPATPTRDGAPPSGSALAHPQPPPPAPPEAPPPNALPAGAQAPQSSSEMAAACRALFLEIVHASPRDLHSDDFLKTVLTDFNLQLTAGSSTSSVEAHGGGTLPESSWSEFRDYLLRHRQPWLKHFALARTPPPSSLSGITTAGEIEDAPEAAPLQDPRREAGEQWEDRQGAAPKSAKSESEAAGGDGAEKDGGKKKWRRVSAVFRGRSAVLGMRLERMRQIFHSVDRNGDGLINVRELILALRKDANVASFLELPMHVKQEDGTRDTFEKVFQAIDRDGDRDISWEEFKKYFVSRDGPSAEWTYRPESPQQQGTEPQSESPTPPAVVPVSKTSGKSDGGQGKVQPPGTSGALVREAEGGIAGASAGATEAAAESKSPAITENASPLRLGTRGTSSSSGDSPNRSLDRAAIAAANAAQTAAMPRFALGRRTSSSTSLNPPTPVAETASTGTDAAAADDRVARIRNSPALAASAGGSGEATGPASVPLGGSGDDGSEGAGGEGSGPNASSGGASGGGAAPEAKSILDAVAHQDPDGPGGTALAAATAPSWGAAEEVRSGGAAETKSSPTSSYAGASGGSGSADSFGGSILAPDESDGGGGGGSGTGTGGGSGGGSSASTGLRPGLIDAGGDGGAAAGPGGTALAAAEATAGGSGTDLDLGPGGSQSPRPEAREFGASSGATAPAREEPLSGGGAGSSNSSGAGGSALLGVAQIEDDGSGSGGVGGSVSILASRHEDSTSSTLPLVGGTSEYDHSGQSASHQALEGPAVAAAAAAAASSSSFTDPSSPQQAHGDDQRGSESKAAATPDNFEAVPALAGGSGEADGGRSSSALSPAAFAVQSFVPEAWESATAQKSPPRRSGPRSHAAGSDEAGAPALGTSAQQQQQRRRRQQWQQGPGVGDDDDDDEDEGDGDSRSRGRDSLGGRQGREDDDAAGGGGSVGAAGEAAGSGSSASGSGTGVGQGGTALVAEPDGGGAVGSGGTTEDRPPSGGVAGSGSHDDERASGSRGSRSSGQVMNESPGESRSGVSAAGTGGAGDSAPQIADEEPLPAPAGGQSPPTPADATGFSLAEETKSSSTTIAGGGAAEIPSTAAAASHVPAAGGAPPTTASTIVTVPQVVEDSSGTQSPGGTADSEAATESKGAANPGSSEAGRKRTGSVQEMMWKVAAPPADSFSRRVPQFDEVASAEAETVATARTDAASATAAAAQSDDGKTEGVSPPPSFEAPGPEPGNKTAEKERGTSPSGNVDDAGTPLLLDGKAHASRVERMRQIFHSVDRNGDGLINVRELILALRKDANVASFLELPMHVKQEDGTRDTFEKVFQAIDRDGDRDISWEEFRNYFMNSRSGQGASKAEQQGNDNDDNDDDDDVQDGRTAETAQASSSQSRVSPQAESKAPDEVPATRTKGTPVNARSRQAAGRKSAGGGQMGLSVKTSPTPAAGVLPTPVRQLVAATKRLEEAAEADRIAAASARATLSGVAAPAMDGELAAANAAGPRAQRSPPSSVLAGPARTSRRPADTPGSPTWFAQPSFGEVSAAASAVEVHHPGDPGAGVEQDTGSGLTHELLHHRASGRTADRPSHEDDSLRMAAGGSEAASSAGGRGGEGRILQVSGGEGKIETQHGGGGSTTGFLEEPGPEDPTDVDFDDRPPWDDAAEQGSLVADDSRTTARAGVRTLHTPGRMLALSQRGFNDPPPPSSHAPDLGSDAGDSTADVAFGRVKEELAAVRTAKRSGEGRGASPPRGGAQRHLAHQITIGRDGKVQIQQFEPSADELHSTAESNDNVSAVSSGPQGGMTDEGTQTAAGGATSSTPAPAPQAIAHSMDAVNSSLLELGSSDTAERLTRVMETSTAAMDAILAQHQPEPQPASGGAAPLPPSTPASPARSSTTSFAAAVRSRGSSSRSPTLPVSPRSRLSHARARQRGGDVAGGSPEGTISQSPLPESAKELVKALSTSLSRSFVESVDEEKEVPRPPGPGPDIHVSRRGSVTIIPHSRGAEDAVPAGGETVSPSELLSQEARLRVERQHRLQTDLKGVTDASNESRLAMRRRGDRVRGEERWKGPQGLAQRRDLAKFLDATETMALCDRELTDAKALIQELTRAGEQSNRVAGEGNVHVSRQGVITTGSAAGNNAKHLSGHRPRIHVSRRGSVTVTATGAQGSNAEKSTSPPRSPGNMASPQWKWSAAPPKRLPSSLSQVTTTNLALGNSGRPPAAFEATGRRLDVASARRQMRDISAHQRGAPPIEAPSAGALARQRERIRGTGTSSMATDGRNTAVGVSAEALSRFSSRRPLPAGASSIRGKVLDISSNLKTELRSIRGKKP